MLINGVASSVQEISPIVGFVPQEDIMHRELTGTRGLHRIRSVTSLNIVRETLKSYALLRRGDSFDTCERLVQDVLEALRLEHVSDSPIGDE